MITTGSVIVMHNGAFVYVKGKQFMYTMNTRVRYSETDQTQKLRLSCIINYFQDIATFHSMALGRKAGKDPVEGNVWYLLSWDVTIHRYPELGESVKIITDPYKMKGFYGYRRFFIRDDHDEVLSSGDSIWVLMDPEKKLPVKISDEITDLFVEPDADDTIRVKRKLPVKGDFGHPVSFEVTDFFTDSNHHVNNAYYVQWAGMVLPAGTYVERIRVDYRQSAYRGDILVMEHYLEDSVYRVRFTSKDDTLIALIDMHIRNIEGCGSDD